MVGEFVGWDWLVDWLALGLYPKSSKKKVRIVVLDG